MCFCLSSTSEYTKGVKCGRLFSVATAVVDWEPYPKKGFVFYLILFTLVTG